MTTKEQERAALAKIRKTVADLGENSYLGSAFDGAFELAEQNIEDDAAYSTSFYVEQYHKTLSESKTVPTEIVKLRDENESLERHLKDTRRALEAKAAEVRDLREDQQVLVDRIRELEADLADSNAHHETVIIRLKAKLYDLMTHSA